jgi:hypothetical protein
MTRLRRASGGLLGFLTFCCAASGVVLARDGGAQGWATQSTDHFDIYYQSPQRAHVDAVAREAERAYARISLVLRHQLSGKVPLILVREDRDMPRNEEQARALVLASRAGPADHLVLSAETFEKRPSSVLTHELTHQFVFELLPRADRDAAWVSEALPDHFSGAWQPAELAKLRTELARGRVPAVENLTASDRDWGHAAFDFIAAEYGGQGIRRYLAALRGTSTRAEAVRLAFGVSADDFAAAFQTFVRTRLGDG